MFLRSQAEQSREAARGTSQRARFLGGGGSTVAVQGSLQSSASRRLQALENLHRTFDIHIVYKIRSESTSIFEVSAAIREMLNIERQLRTLPAWASFCSRVVPETQALCQTGVSYANFAFAQLGSAGSHGERTLTFNGLGSAMLPPEVSLPWVEQAGLRSAVLPMHAATGGHGKVRSLRSTFRFKMLCCTRADPMNYREPVMEQLAEDWRMFLQEGILATLERLARESSVVTMDFSMEGDSCSYIEPFLPLNEVLRPDLSSLHLSTSALPFEHLFSRSGGSSSSSSSSSRAHTSWCQDAGLVSWVPGNCSCHRQELDTGCGNAATAQVSLRVLHLFSNRSYSQDGSGSRGDSRQKGEDGWLREAAFNWLQDHGPPAGLLPPAASDLQCSSDTSAGSVHLGKSVLMLGSAAGIAAEPMSEVSVEMRRQSSQASCGWTDVCFCGSQSCRLPQTFQPSGQLTLPSPPPAAAVSEKGSGATRDEHREAVHVVWGLANPVDLAGLPDAYLPDLKQILAGLPLHHNDTLDIAFRNNFGPHVPQSQRDVFGFCRDLPEDLQVVEKNCWVEDFRHWLKNDAKRWPVVGSEFHQFALNFSDGHEFLWVEQGKVKAFFASFILDVRRCAPAEEVAQLKSKWDKYVSQWSASAYGLTNGAWHASRLWGRLKYRDSRNDFFTRTSLGCGRCRFLQWAVSALLPAMTLLLAALPS